MHVINVNFEIIIIKSLPVNYMYRHAFENVPDENPGGNVGKRLNTIQVCLFVILVGRFTI